MRITCGWILSFLPAQVIWNKLSFSNLLNTLPFISTNWLETNNVRSAWSYELIATFSAMSWYIIINAWATVRYKCAFWYGYIKPTNHCRPMQAKNIEMVVEYEPKKAFDARVVQVLTEKTSNQGCLVLSMHTTGQLSNVSMWVLQETQNYTKTIVPLERWIWRRVW
jgi:hypothetical protein